MAPVGKPPVALDEFLNPKSMLTPGICGGLTTLITGVLTQQFGLLPNYTGLATSFLFGLLVVFGTTSVIPAWQKCIYLCLNSLVIFSVAMGANQAGLRVAESQPRPKPPPNTSSASLPTPFFSNWLDGTASKRAQLVAQVGNVDDANAKKALHVLNLATSNANSPKDTLAWYAASARTSDEVDTFLVALKRDDQEELPHAP